MEEKSQNQRKNLSNLIRTFGNIIFWSMALLAAMMVVSLAHSKVTGTPPKVAGHHMYIVLSGSMRPAFDTGSLAFVKPLAPGEVEEGDIITFRGYGERENLVSHRVMSVDASKGDISFVT